MESIVILGVERKIGPCPACGQEHVIEAWEPDAMLCAECVDAGLVPVSDPEPVLEGESDSEIVTSAPF